MFRIEKMPQMESSQVHLRGESSIVLENIGYRMRKHDEDRKRDTATDRLAFGNWQGRLGWAGARLRALRTVNSSRRWTSHSLSDCPTEGNCPRGVSVSLRVHALIRDDGFVDLSWACGMESSNKDHHLASPSGFTQQADSSAFNVNLATRRRRIQSTAQHSNQLDT